jgi:hypothetical protein
VPGIYDNSQFFIEDPRDSLKAQLGNDCSPTDPNEELQYSTEAAG